jgi:alpha-amylase
MASVILYFQVHQPCRLRRYLVFDTHHDYFDTDRNAQILRKIAENCYRPATRLLLELVQRHAGRFRLAFSLSGTVIEQLQEHAPDVLDLFRELAGTGCCEFLGETYYHSLSSLTSRREFVEQVEMHSRRTAELFGSPPQIFRNTELIYSSEIARTIASLRDSRGHRRFAGMLAEGVESLLGARSPNQLYTAPGAGAGDFRLLLRNYRLSDDIAFRYSNRAWEEWPLTPEKFARWVDACAGPVCNIFMDYETFGEHQWRETGIFDFLSAFPDAVLAAGPRAEFLTPSEAITRAGPAPEYDAPSPTSWADTERDLSAWCGNAMQHSALQEHAGLEDLIRRAAAHDDPECESLMTAWRRLSTSDHFYYMCTKYFADGDVHKYFNPYESPYDSFINYTNILDDLRTRALAAATQPIPA